MRCLSLTNRPQPPPPPTDRPPVSRLSGFSIFGLLLALLIVACNRTAPPLPAAESAPARQPAPPTSDLDDGRPQTGLPRIRIYLGAHELNAELALNRESIQKGMMWRTNVSDDEAMLFVFGRAHRTSFWMKNVPIDIDVAYLDPEGTIREIHRLTRHNTNPVEAATAQIQYALETAPGWFARHGVSTGALVRSEHGSLPETFFRRAPRSQGAGE